MSELSLERCTSNMKSIALTILELLAFNARKFKGSRPRPLLENFFGAMSGFSLGTRVSNLKTVALTVLELLAFNAQKFRGSRDPAHAHFKDCSQNIFFGMLKGSCIPNLGKDRSKTELTILAVIAGCTDTGRTLKWFYILSNAVHCIGQTKRIRKLVLS